MFYVIPGMCSLDGARSSSIDQQFGRNSTDSTEKSKGDAPRQTSSLWNIGPTGRCFKTNPQHARPLSGANSLAASEVRFDGGPPPADLRPSQGKAEARYGRREGRSSRSWYLCVQNKPAKEETPNVEPRGGVGVDVPFASHTRLVMPSRLRLSVINLNEALSLLDCGSKRKRRPARLKEGTRPKILGTVLTLVHPWGVVSECVVRACVRLANPCPPSRVLKPYPLTLLVGADDRLSGSAAPNSWPRRLLGAVSLFLWPVSISVGAAFPFSLSRASLSGGDHGLGSDPRCPLLVNPARRSRVDLADCGRGRNA